MQTFLPYPDFVASAASLDPRRLGKQRVEALQVLRGLTVPGYGWRHHPAVRMWVGYQEALVRYGLEICRVWTATGRADTCAASLLTEFSAQGDGGGAYASTTRGAPRVAAMAGGSRFPPQPPVRATGQGSEFLHSSVPRRSGRPALHVAGLRPLRLAEGDPGLQDLAATCPRVPVHTVPSEHPSLAGQGPASGGTVPVGAGGPRTRGAIRSPPPCVAPARSCAAPRGSTTDGVGGR